MIALDTVEHLMVNWRNEFKHGSFSYAKSDVRFGAVVTAHFHEESQKVYGVYVIRQEATREILYIGKGGTINGQGQYKGQDVPGRLCATRGKDELGKDISSESWFRELLQEVGPFEVEYLAVKPPVSPGYIEAALLQAYLAEYSRLPLKNKSL